MKIAFISYEYPPDTALGGIATYVYQASIMLSKRGHQVEVFCGTTSPSHINTLEGMVINRVFCHKRENFLTNVVTYFGNRHKLIDFDLFETPEFCADGLEIKKAFPDLKMVVKLHTPHFLLFDINFLYDSFLKKLRFMLMGLLRGKINKPYWKHVNISNDIEFEITKLADQIQTPSVSLGDIVSKKWSISRTKILNVPYPYIPNKDMLNIPANTNTKTVTFLGRLEIRKGVVALSRAIPLVLEKFPQTQFRFIGSNTETSPSQKMDMLQYLKYKLSSHLDNISFDKVSHDEVASVYATTDICIFPSIWENFPNVCLEAMSAARGVIGSSEGGMADMLETDCGLLINPLNYKEIADAIIYLLENPLQRQTMGANARKKIINSYNKEVIGSLMESSYNQLLDE